MTEVKVCLHCGNKTQMELINSHEHEEGEFEYDDEQGPYQIGAYFEKYNFYKCPVCNRFTLELEESNTFYIESNGAMPVTTKILYPAIETSLSKLPSGVKAAYQAAQKVRNIDGAICAIAIRRTLEKMCKDQGVTGRDLYTKLKQLSEKGIIPPILDEMSFLIKDIGNQAAHADEGEFDEHLINSLLKFTSIILEYVYALPSEIKKIQRYMSTLTEEKEEKVIGENRKDGE
ncbi:DUF4145 domain-containing protein [Neobacillus terrae]|uniref:DUF4145 domain-containing protein n=1 Tax=Neobacillus terrae TaxID=3034837 RepID=UPI00140DDAD2|nr:DUF4145 domain-containing protein [Neobacillus terrae]NHM29916.1 DUF4145 domain-containing protein [Neobacillus terrae]